MEETVARTFRLSAIASAVLSGLAFLASSWAQSPQPIPGKILFTDVRVFDGVHPSLSPATNVLVQGNKIVKISTAPIPVDRSGLTQIVEGNGRTLMPGLIDAHVHLQLAGLPMMVMITADSGYVQLVAAQTAKGMLMRGFTSVRDMAGETFGLKRAIDEGLVPGPRIWPSGAMISQTSGHGDFRMPGEVPRVPGAPLSRGEQLGVGMIADGVDQVLVRSREQLMLGATQIKLSAGGGVASSYDPLDVSQYTEAEFHAAVDAAQNWGTYVAVHAYTPKAIQTAIHAGVQCIEHGQLMDEETAKLMSEKGTWLSAQPFLDDEDANSFPEGSANRAKQMQMSQGTDTAYRLAKQYKLKTAWGTDIVNSPGLLPRQGAMLAKMVRWYTPGEVLVMATSTNAELLALSGPRNPYPGKLGVIEEGALADLLMVQGDPIGNIKLVEDPDTNFVIIMKDGRIFKNSLQR